MLDHLRTRETAFALTSRAPYDKIAAAAKERGWWVPWYSSYGTDFNYDYQVTLDADRGQDQYNYRAEPDLLGDERSVEMSGRQQVEPGVGAAEDIGAAGEGRVGVEDLKGRVTPVRGGDPTFTS